MTSTENFERGSAQASSPYLLVSSDSHAGPHLEEHLRKYCADEYLGAFDRFAEEFRHQLASGRQAWANGAYRGAAKGLDEALDLDLMSEEARTAGLLQIDRITANAGSFDPHARLDDMDQQGIAAEVIFAGAQNRQALPWAGTASPELAAAGGHIWNQWLADFVAEAPERLLGVAQIPIWDIELAVREVHWAKDHGLRGLNFPAPKSEFPAYNELVYEPFWRAVEEVNLPLLTHAASGEPSSGATGVGAAMLFLTEVMWLSRRGLPQLIWGGVLDRHPTLRFAFVEQRSGWVKEALDEMDSAFIGIPSYGSMPLLGAKVDLPARQPSDYWRSNFAVGDSFMARHDVERRHEIGLETIMWGTDYPHIEGTWPNTLQALRHTFHDVPEADVRAILGGNAVAFFELDEEVLGPLAERIGPTPSAIAEPLDDDEFPPFRGFAFRESGHYH